jgi:Bifunctional DNA primase/polymerase, N-terminal
VRRGDAGHLDRADAIGRLVALFFNSRGGCDGAPVSSSVSELAEHIDARAHNGLVVAPGSTYNDNVYQWEPGRAPWEVNMAEIPAPLLQRLLQKRAASYSGGEPAPECELDCDEAQQATEHG